VPPGDVARRGREAGLAAIALTDHDTLDGVAVATAAGAALGLRVICGCEFSVKASWGEMHVLGYFLRAGHARLEAFLRETREARRRRGVQMVERLQRLGIAIDVADVTAQAGGGAVGRPHVARALVARGAAAHLQDAFSRFLGRGKAGYVEKPLPEFEIVAELVHEVGGVTVAAHVGDRGSEAQLRQFKARGLDGVEVRHPRHSAAIEARLTRLAAQLDLAVSGGSDWHGDGDAGDTHAPLGGLRVPAEWLAALERRATGQPSALTADPRNG
jgi:predicted metal-dependent phosphoesterase TrpH